MRQASLGKSLRDDTTPISLRHCLMKNTVKSASTVLAGGVCRRGHSIRWDGEPAVKWHPWTTTQTWLPATSTKCKKVHEGRAQCCIYWHRKRHAAAAVSCVPAVSMQPRKDAVACHTNVAPLPQTNRRPTSMPQARSCTVARSRYSTGQEQPSVSVPLGVVPMTRQRTLCL